jgi:coenzyme F420-0:L-glutamate ligase / coenzyme F420-1:gamma-L-glutamate ligase
VNLAEAVAARRSVRSFLNEPVPPAAIERAVTLAVQAPAPHHSQPWRFALLDSAEDKSAFSTAMGRAWRRDLEGDGLPPERIEAVLGRSHRLLTSSPLLTVCCADMSRAHVYSDDRRRLAEWSLFAHAVGAALQVYMTALAEDGIASCWISAPVFCRDVVRRHLKVDPSIEPHALVLAGYPSPSYRPRSRGPIDPAAYILDRRRAPPPAP